MNLYVFVCKNLTNIWAGIGSRTWAVSEADPAIMKGRKTRAQNIQIGQYGIIYCSDETSLTTPFLITSSPDPEEKVSNIWPETWSMPFGIHPLGTPRKLWNAHDAAATLPFNKDKSNTNIASVFKIIGTVVFSPIDIEDEDWAIIIGKLSDISR
jgi:hypothetical protein